MPGRLVRPTGDHLTALKCKFARKHCSLQWPPFAKTATVQSHSGLLGFSFLAKAQAEVFVDSESHIEAFQTIISIRGLLQIS